MKRTILRSLLKRVGRVTLFVLLACVCCLAIAWMMFPFPSAKLATYPTSAIISDRNGRALRMVKGDDDVVCLSVRLDEVGPWVVPALIAAEDKRFYQHPGIDPLAILRAIIQDITSKQIVSGASTISSQVVRLIESRPRNWRSKLIEAFRALQMERLLTKKQILEQYLNRAPFGSDIVGVEAASLRYFGKSTRDLSLSEAALLVGLPQAPSRLRPDRHLDQACRRRDTVLSRMAERGFINDEQRRAARAQPIACCRREAILRSPHFCDLVEARYGAQRSARTTLDERLQQIAEDVLAGHARQLSQKDISNGAIVIIEVSTGAVRAMVGSPDFRDDRHAGQVNAAVARRSPGSALKPFVYAMAIDEGICTPATVLADVPMIFPAYRPENFDREFLGPVTVREALVRSLNIPALTLTEQVGQENFMHLLRRAGFTTLEKPCAHYGLGVVLGSGEVTLLELANAYACLARLGTYRPYRLLEKEKTNPPTRLFSAEAAYLVAEMLSGDERALEVCGHAADVKLPRVAWKTGTSSGFRDAWTVAYNPDYVVSVWLGNHDGHGSSDLVGNEAAAPLAYDIFRRLYPDGEGPWFHSPDGLKTRLVCARSGLPSNEYCGAVVPDPYIPGISATRECAVHQRVPFNRQTQLPVRWGALNDDRRTVERDARQFRITAPVSGEVFCLIGNVATIKQEIALSISTDSASEKLYWFVDGVMFRACEPGQTVFWPLKKGRFVITCSDSLGCNDSVKIQVE